MSGMSCSTASVLFENYAKATMKYFEATDKLTALVGQHEGFAEAKKNTDWIHAKCHDARRALEQHWEQHRCRAPESSVANPSSCPV